MLVSDNGKIMELPDDIRAFDEYKMYGKTLIVHYVNEKHYGIYYHTDSGLDLKANGIKFEPKFYEPNFIWFISSEDDDVLYNTASGIIIACGNFKFDIYDGIRFKVFILKFYEGSTEKYRVFDDKGNEILDSEFVGVGKKVELITYKNFGNILPLRIRQRIRHGKFYSDHKGILHIIFNKDGTSKVIKVIPPSYDGVDLNSYVAVEDDAGKIHYPTYTAIKNGKETCFTFAGKKIKLPSSSWL